ncbi:MAG: cupredoxin domain-containing protein [Xanthobacteraceae bacterium]|jgi:uncharacterized cupredoxin-like copper-binding protein
MVMMRRGRAGGRLAALAAALAGVALMSAAPAPVKIDVVMVDYEFRPNHLTFERGVHYQIHLENHGEETHEFTAPVFFATAKIDNPDILNREQAEVLMQPGDKKDLFLTPTKPGTYDLRCADHDWYGMVGGITVK